MAVRRRKPLPGLIFHSDRGVQYAAYAYRQRLASLGIDVYKRQRVAWAVQCSNKAFQDMNRISHSVSHTILLEPSF